MGCADPATSGGPRPPGPPARIRSQGRARGPGPARLRLGGHPCRPPVRLRLPGSIVARLGAFGPLFAHSAWPLAPGPLPRGGPAPARRARPCAPPGRPPRCAARPLCAAARLRGRSLRPAALRARPRSAPGLPVARPPLRLGLPSALRGPARGPPALLCGAGLRPRGLCRAARGSGGPPAPGPAARPRLRGLALRRGFAGGSRRPRAPVGGCPCAPPPRRPRGGSGERKAGLPVNNLSIVNRPICPTLRRYAAGPVTRAAPGAGAYRTGAGRRGARHTREVRLRRSGYSFRVTSRVPCATLYPQGRPRSAMNGGPARPWGRTRARAVARAFVVFGLDFGCCP